MNNLLNLFIYIDEYLLKNLSSVYLNGYIDTCISKKICDNTLSKRIHFDENSKTFCNDVKSRVYNKGSKTITKSNEFNETVFCDNDKSIENKLLGRTEEEVKRIYTSFEIQNNLLKRMNALNTVKDINNLPIFDCPIFEGDFVKIKGSITEISISYYLDSLIGLIECFPLETLDKLLKDKELGDLNFSIILNLLKTMKDKLSLNQTEDIVLNCSGYSAILNTNSKYFLNRDCYDFTRCNCNVLGKVVKVYKNNNTYINLLRKLTQENYYTDLLKSIDPYLNLLKGLNIPIPKCPKLKIKSPVLLIIPVSIYF